MLVLQTLRNLKETGLDADLGTRLRFLTDLVDKLAAEPGAVPRNDFVFQKFIASTVPLCEGCGIDTAVYAMWAFCCLSLRAPLRDMIPILTSIMKEKGDGVDGEDLGKMVTCLNYLGRGKLFAKDLFEIVSRHLDLLDSNATCVYFYECTRHGAPSLQYGQRALSKVYSSIFACRSVMNQFPCK
jgi:hypothetical protein